MSDELITVITPVHNGGAYLGEALCSALNQTYRTLEVIVVDDGSSDASFAIASQHAAKDRRVRVLQQPQRGPASARNLAISHARGELIAPLDADDLWLPTKLERQIEAMREGGSRVGLVYTWFALIDEQGRIQSTGHRPTACGDVLHECCRRNLVGNGSSPMMRKAAILECGGYDEALQGSEDYKLYVAIAERHHFAVVPEHLTGYRQTSHNLTSKIEMMYETGDIVFSDLERRHPEARGEIHSHRLDFCHWLLRRGALAFDARWSIPAKAMWRLDKRYALRSFAGLPKDLIAAKWGPRFPPWRGTTHLEGTSCFFLTDSQTGTTLS